MANKVYFEDVKVGDEIPKWVKQTDFMHWNRYAAVNDEFIDVHMDAAAARAVLVLVLHPDLGAGFGAIDAAEQSEGGYAGKSSQVAGARIVSNENGGLVDQ